jgi:hypothetical protein
MIMPYVQQYFNFIPITNFTHEEIHRAQINLLIYHGAMTHFYHRRLYECIVNGWRLAIFNIRGIRLIE